MAVLGAAMYAAGPNYGFLIRDAVESRSADNLPQIHSREDDSGNKPRLVISFD